MKRTILEWQELTLYKLLHKKTTVASAAAQNTLINCLPLVCETLRAGNTSPNDFTLHDDRHSQRVATRMSEVIPAAVITKLSEYELTLLILSAYLHDIGMTPSKGKVAAHYQYVLTGDPTLLTNDLPDFRRWLGDNVPDANLPLGTVPLTTVAISKAERITALYCRFKHNDWSEEWIRANLSHVTWDGYKTWLDDLILLCKSHHHGYAELTKPHFDPKLVASSRGSIVHLRYLACVLRVADILEFDPERTPEVLFRHRAISHESTIFWHKDHAIQRAISADRKQVFISAQPSTAKLHKAILQMIDGIDAELLLCRRLAEEVHFESFPGMAIILAHRWDLPSITHRQIKPQENTYVYIEGAFRPDTEKLLQLLSGTQLYGSFWAGVREMLQNAFDAVKEAIAYEWLAGSTTDPARLNALASLHEVAIHFEFKNDEVVLVCRDSGVGMSKSIIENHMLVSGSARRSDLTELERRCVEKGFALSRTGQFGIGVLSYFMLADRVTITTRRSGLCDDAESNGWHFETEGVGSFGELKSQNVHRQGTTLKLHLAQNICIAPATFYNDLKGYIHSTLTLAPCNVKISSNLDSEITEYQMGWLKSTQRLTHLLVSAVDSFAYDESGIRRDLLPVSRQRELEKTEAYWQTIKNEMQDHVEWRTETGSLEQALGHYRIHIPVFKMKAGVSLAFVRPGSNDRLLRVGKGFCFIPRPVAYHSWKGMTVRSSRSLGRPDVGLVEIDWTDRAAGEISIARSEFIPTAAAKIANQVINAKISKLMEQIACENRQSKFSSLNFRIAELPDLSPNKPAWIKGYSEGAWKKIEFPAISRLSYAYESRTPTKLSLKNEKVEIISCLRQPHDDDEYDGLAWNSSSCSPDKIVVLSDTDFNVVPLWERAPQDTIVQAIGLTAAFPGKWSNCVAAHFDCYSELQASATVWNRNHPLAKAVTVEAKDWVTVNLPTHVDPLTFRELLLDKPSYGAAWISVSIDNIALDYWNGIRDRDKQFLDKLWALLRIKPAMRYFSFLHNTGVGVDAYSISPAGWNLVKASEVFKEPGPSWLIEVS
jgi:hypothetical protein